HEGENPATLNELVPEVWATPPCCGDGAVFYRVLQNRVRFLVGCRRHYRLWDSTLGFIGRHVTVPPPQGYRASAEAERLGLTVTFTDPGRPPRIGLSP
ncbi:MAG TPA: hypothetical protein VGO93_01425, partial [Candidatus Xenobia bacterium]